LTIRTGKSSQYADTKQLELLALLTFKHFPQVKIIKAGLVFLVATDLIKAKFEEGRTSIRMAKMDARDTKTRKRLSNKCLESKNQNFTCRKFCAVVDCEHNGRNLIFLTKGESNEKTYQRTEDPESFKVRPKKHKLIWCVRLRLRTSTRSLQILKKENLCLWILASMCICIPQKKLSR
jgi:hypothetical protein